MRQVILPGTGLLLSRFSFGTAGLFNAGPAKTRARLLAAAYDHGFTHFDTAPYYGFGMAERDLKPLLRAHRQITVTTKVGIYSPGGEEQREYSIFLRKAAGRLFPAISRPAINWGISRARDSLTASLKRLGRERVDLYMLHEPDIRLLNCDEWWKWLVSEHDRVAHFGIAVDFEKLKPFLQAAHPLTSIIQTVDSIEMKEADILTEYKRSLQITYGYISAARRNGKSNIKAVLEAALTRNQYGSVIVSTAKIERLAQYAEIAAASARIERDLLPGAVE